MRILTEAERQAIRDKLPKPKFTGNPVWETYLNTNYIRTDRIGETISFVRYGNIPPDGISRAWIRRLGPPHKTYPHLKGISVFELINGFEVYPIGYDKDLFQRPRIIGTGTIVGWGPDGEPLVKI